MKTGNIAARQPVEVELKAGVSYKWCRCGLSKTQPYCDDVSHVGTGIEPKVFKVISTRKVWLCMCKQTKTLPYCDGTHNSLK
jgi:CDGSH-type Zn-finger protein